MLPKQAKMDNAQDVEDRVQVEKRIVEKLRQLPKEEAKRVIALAIDWIEETENQ